MTTKPKKYPGSTPCPDCKTCPECGHIVHAGRPLHHAPTCSLRLKMAIKTIMTAVTTASPPPWPRRGDQ